MDNDKSATIAEVRQIIKEELSNLIRNEVSRQMGTFNLHQSNIVPGTIRGRHVDLTDAGVHLDYAGQTKKVGIGFSKASEAYQEINHVATLADARKLLGSAAVGLDDNDVANVIQSHYAFRISEMGLGIFDINFQGTMRWAGNGSGSFDTTLGWAGENTLYTPGDLMFTTPTTGVILTDRTTSDSYRLFVDSGILDIEVV